MPSQFSLNFAFAYDQPKSEAQFRSENKDFLVTEQLGFTPSGSGEHLLLHITKNGQNTAWVAQQLANFVGIKVNDVGYCGRKDRHAICQQWFSIYLPKQPLINWQHCAIEGVEINSLTQHDKKLRPGDHVANNFQIMLRNITDIEEIKSRLQKVTHGVPNYFGEQRFGHQANNLVEGEQWAEGTSKIHNKKHRGIIISALRAYLFNLVLSERVSTGNWQQALPGDMSADEPTGPLWGRGRSLVTDQTNLTEQNALTAFKTWQDALEHCGLQQERRPLICLPQDFSYEIADNNLKLNFRLQPGQFATSVLREITCLQNKASEQLLQ